MKEEICNGVKKATFSYYSLAKFTFGIDEHEARPAITIIKKKERKIVSIKTYQIMTFDRLLF